MPLTPCASVGTCGTRLHGGCEVDSPTSLEVEEHQGAVLPRLDPAPPTSKGDIPRKAPEDDPAILCGLLLVNVNLAVTANAEINHVDYGIPTSAPSRLTVVNRASGIPIGNPMEILGKNPTAPFTQTLTPIPDGILRGMQTSTHGRTLSLDDHRSVPFTVDAVCLLVEHVDQSGASAAVAANLVLARLLVLTNLYGRVNVC